MKRFYLFFMVIVVVVIYLTCTQDVAGTNDETSGGIIASLYYKDGTPAKNAIVKIFEVSDTTKLPVYTALTNDKGEYEIDSIKVGTYNVWGAKDTLVAFQGSILFTATASNLKDDTLERGGSITGIVGLEPTDDPRTVTVQILGSEISVENVDTSGRFTIADLAEGSYKLKLATTLPNYTTTYYTIQKSGAVADTLTDTLWLIYTGIPVVTGMKVSYDTLHGLVTLSWNKVQYQNFQDFLVYRAYENSIQWPVTPISRTKSTIFVDSVFKTSIVSGPFSFSDTNDYYFKYRVCVRNNSDQIGLPYKYVDIKTPSTTKVRTFFSWKYLNTIADSASINDSVSIIISYRNATRKNMELCWYIGSKDSLFKTKNDSSLTGTDSIKYTWVKASKPKIYLSMVDEGQTTWWDSTMLNIVQDVPVADAGKDTNVTINSPAILKGKAAQAFGAIVIYKWDYNGDGTYDDSSATNPAMSHTYTHEAAYNAKFYVRDDDGNEATDIRIITVRNSAPVITSILPDTTISVGDSIKLWAVAVDNDGTIKECAWDGNGDGVFEHVSVMESTTGYRYNDNKAYNAIFRVTDDDGKVTKDTVTIIVYDSISDIDGNIYKILKIGNQEWTIENLRTTKYNDGTEIPLVTDGSAWSALTTPGYCCYNNTADSAFIKRYGVLYNWYAVDTKKLAPAGWHVPTDADWDTLQNYLIANGYNWNSSTSGNKIAKAMASKTDWVTTIHTGAIGNDLSTNNRCGFSAHPGGFRKYDGNFYNQNSNGYWWSATASVATHSYYRNLYYSGDYLIRGSDIISSGFSVRLVRD